jgi:hypothetical protein
MYVVAILAVLLALVSVTRVEEWGPDAIRYLWLLFVPFVAFLLLYTVAWVLFWRGWRRTGMLIVLCAMWTFIAGLFLLALLF